MEEAAVPVEDHQEVVDEAAGSEEVRVVGVTFCPVHEGPEPVDLHLKDKFTRFRKIQFLMLMYFRYK